MRITVFNCPKHVAEGMLRVFHNTRGGTFRNDQDEEVVSSEADVEVMGPFFQYLAIAHPEARIAVTDGDEATERLNAAAPDMLVALKACVEPTEPGSDCALPASTYNLVCAAIQKAEEAP